MTYVAFLAVSLLPPVNFNNGLPLGTDPPGALKI